MAETISSLCSHSDDQSWKIILGEANEDLLKLLDIKATFFSVNRNEKTLKMQILIDKILERTKYDISSAISSEIIAQISYIRGRALDCKEEYSEEAEIELSKAVKLNPEEIDYWNSMGHCFWKKSDIKSAEICFNNALKQCINQVSLRELSKLLRQIPVRTAEEKSQKLHQSLTKAKQAVQLDVSDSESWYVLGNAYVSMFFSLTPKPVLMENALIAYGKAEQNGGQKNPDLYFGRAQVYRYQENFENSAQDYRKAYDLDPSLPCIQALHEIDVHVKNTFDLIHKRKTKNNQILNKYHKIDQISKGLKQYELPKNVPYQLSNFNNLKTGVNPGFAIALKMIAPIGQNDFPPSCYLMCDCEGSLMSVALYHMNAQGLTDRGSILLLNPCVAEIAYTKHSQGENNDYDTTGDEYPMTLEYRGLQVKHADMLLVNGEPLRSGHDAQLKLTAFDQ